MKTGQMYNAGVLCVTDRYGLDPGMSVNSVDVIGYTI